MSVKAAALELSVVEALDVEAFAVFAGADERPLAGLGGILDWRLAGAISRLIEGGLFAGQSAEALLTTTNGQLKAPRVFAFGVGAGPMDAARFTIAAADVADRLGKAGLKSAAVGLPEFPGAAVSAKILVEALKRLPIEITILGDRAILDPLVR